MDGATIVQIIIFAIAISTDAFAIAVADGLIFKDITKRQKVFIASTFGIMQALMPLAGFWITELIKQVVGQTAGKEAGNIVSLVIVWIAFSLLLIVGAKMIIESIISIRKKDKDIVKKEFSVKEVLAHGVMTSIDAFAVGVSLNAGISTIGTIWLHILLILIITFLLSIIGAFLGGIFNRMLKGKYEIACIIGGAIIMLLAIWIVVSHYLDI